MTLSGIWGSYHYDASHTIRELGCYINTIKIEYLSLVCTLTTRLSTSVILRFLSSFVPSARLKLTSCGPQPQVLFYLTTKVIKEFWSTTRIPPISCIKLSVVQTITSPTTHYQLTCLSLVRCKFFYFYSCPNLYVFYHIWTLIGYLCV